MNNNLTDREREIYNYILNAIKNEGYSPSVRDICNALNMKSTSTVHTYLERLERKGMIQKESGKSRTLRIENEGIHASSTVRVPILGKVAAGMPILAVENLAGITTVSRRAKKPYLYFRRAVTALIFSFTAIFYTLDAQQLANVLRGFVTL